VKISVSIITLNEIDYIRNAISSCSFADEIVVVDGGSTDGTQDFLKSLDKRITLIESPWDNDFSKQRQKSLDACTGDWVVRIDSDEVFSEVFETEIRSYLENTNSNAITIRQCNLVGNIDYYSKRYDNFESIPRIFKKTPAIKWKNKIHEIITGIEGTIDQWNVYVVHFGFLDKKKYSKKGEFYSTIPGSGFQKKEDLLYREYDIVLRPLQSYEKESLRKLLKKQFASLVHKKPSLAIVRGPNLNEWEMKNYELLMDRYDITAYTTEKHNFSLDKIKIPVIKLPAHPESPIYMLGLEYELFDKDIIYTADITWLFSLQGAVARKKFGNKLVVLEWENIPLIYHDNENISNIKRTVTNSADAFVAVTERAADALRIEGADRDKIYKIPMGIDVDFFTPDKTVRNKARSELKLNNGDRIVLFVGRFVFEKGIYDILFASKLLFDENPDLKKTLKFLMIGRGPEKDRFTSMVKRLSLEDNFIILPQSSYLEMKKYYNSADIFILPSIPKENWKEQFGMAIVEAMACGVPVISTYSGSIPEVIGEAGLLVQPNDPQSIYNGIMKLLKNETLRQELGKLARQRAVEMFSCKVVSEQIDTLFKKILVDKFGTTDSNETMHQSCMSENKGISYYSQKREEIISLIPESAKKILDVGCGTGEMGAALQSMGKFVTGIEREGDIASIASGRLSNVIKGDIEQIDLNSIDEQYDCIVFGDVIEHLINPEETFNKVTKLLSNSGSVIVSVPNVRNISIISQLIEGNWTYQKAGILDETHLRFFTFREIERMLSRNGFRIDSIKTNCVLPKELGNLNYDSRGLTSIKVGRTTINDLTEEDIKDFFTIQYIVKASKVATNVVLEDDINNLLENAYKFENEGIFDAAIESYEKILEKYPRNGESINRIARCLFTIGDYQKAETKLKQISDNYPINSAYINTAICYKKLKKYEMALNYLKKVNDKDGEILSESDLFETFIQTGDCLANLMKDAEAKENYLAAEKINPKSEKPLIGLGSLAILNGNNEIARKYFEKAIAINADNCSALTGLGIAHWNNGKKKEALSLYSKTLELNIENPQAIYLIVQAASELGQLEIAEQYLERYICLHPANIDMLFSLSVIYFRVGKYQKAMELADRIMIFAPGYDGINELIAEIEKITSSSGSYCNEEKISNYGA